jgi:hypothetical protein
VHLSYDAMAGLLAQYENAEALQVARDLDELLSELLLSESEGAVSVRPSHCSHGDQIAKALTAL